MLSSNTLLRFATVTTSGEIDLLLTPILCSYSSIDPRAHFSTSIPYLDVTPSDSALGSNKEYVLLRSTSSSYFGGMSISMDLNNLNPFPYSDFVLPQAHINSVSLCCKVSSSCAILSVIRKHQLLMCVLALPNNIGPFFASRLVDFYLDKTRYSQMDNPAPP